MQIGRVQQKCTYTHREKNVCKNIMNRQTITNVTVLSVNGRVNIQENGTGQPSVISENSQKIRTISFKSSAIQFGPGTL